LFAFPLWGEGQRPYHYTPTEALEQGTLALMTATPTRSLRGTAQNPNVNCALENVGLFKAVSDHNASTTQDSRFPHELGRIDRLSLLCLCPLMLLQHGVRQADDVITLVDLDHVQGVTPAQNVS
jgi:hypothetical protein